MKLPTWRWYAMMYAWNKPNLIVLRVFGTRKSPKPLDRKSPPKLLSFRLPGNFFQYWTKRRASFQMFRVHLTLWGYTFSSCCSWDVLKSNGTTPMPTPRRKETWFMDYNGIMVVRDPPIRPYSISCFAFLTTYYINGMILQVWVYMVYIPIIRIQVMAWSSKWAP